MYVCPACGRHIGLMADAKGEPTLFKCVWTGRVVGPQVVERREQPKRKRFKKNRAQPYVGVEQ